MRWLAVSARWATRRPWGVIAVIFVTSVLMGAFALRAEIEVDLVELGSDDSAPVRTMDRVRTEFDDPAAAVQIIIDAGRGGDILRPDGLAAVASAEQLALDALGGAVERGDQGDVVVVSLPRAMRGPQVAAEQGGSGTGASVGDLIRSDPRLAGLVSDDVDLERGSARATAVIAQLDPALDEAQRREAATRVREALVRERTGELRTVGITVVSSGSFVQGMLDAVRAEVPLLFGMALLAVIGLLAAMYRSVFDVVVGVLGLVATLVWTFGSAALLGPGFLGWVGPLSQFVVVIPVLLVGLGIDHSVHLTARFREERAEGTDPPTAALQAVRRVGVALALATVATAVGFASTAIAPLRMLADFGLVVAVGVVAAFIIMVLLVPSAQVLRHRHTGASGRENGRVLGSERAMGVPVRLARSAPGAGLLVAAAVVAAAGGAAPRLPVEFDRDAFIPVGSEVEAALDHQRELFGGGVTETTFVVIDGDLAQPDLANAVLDAHERLADVGAVRTVGDQPQAVSAVSFAASAAQASDDPGPLLDPELRAPGVDQGDDVPAGPSRVFAGDRFAEDAPLAGIYDRVRAMGGTSQVDRLLTEDDRSALVRIRTTAGDTGAQRVRGEIESAFAPVREAGASVAVTSEPIILAETSEALSRFQAQAIALTLVAVTIILTLHYASAVRYWVLGPIAMLPAVVSAALIIGAMWVTGTSYNVVTATLTAIAVGIGVPYGVHVVNRFAQDLAHVPPDRAVLSTLRGTGSALAGSALTTLAAFLMLALSDLPPMRSLGLLGAVGIAGALVGGILVEPGACVAWARRRRD